MAGPYAKINATRAGISTVYRTTCYVCYLQTPALRISQVVPNRAATSPARVKPEAVTVVPIVTVDQPEIIE